MSKLSRALCVSAFLLLDFKLVALGGSNSGGGVMKDSQVSD